MQSYSAEAKDMQEMIDPLHTDGEFYYRFNGKKLDIYSCETRKKLGSRDLPAVKRFDYISPQPMEFVDLIAIPGKRVLLIDKHELNSGQVILNSGMVLMDLNKADSELLVYTDPLMYLNVSTEFRNCIYRNGSIVTGFLGPQSRNRYYGALDLTTKQEEQIPLIHVSDPAGLGGVAFLSNDRFVVDAGSGMLDIWSRTSPGKFRQECKIPSFEGQATNFVGQQNSCKNYSGTPVHKNMLTLADGKLAIQARPCYDDSEVVVSSLLQIRNADGTELVRNFGQQFGGFYGMVQFADGSILLGGKPEGEMVKQKNFQGEMVDRPKVKLETTLAIVNPDAAGVEYIKVEGLPEQKFPGKKLVKRLDGVFLEIFNKKEKIVLPVRREKAKVSDLNNIFKTFSLAERNFPLPLVNIISEYSPTLAVGYTKAEIAEAKTKGKLTRAHEIEAKVVFMDSRVPKEDASATVSRSSASKGDEKTSQASGAGASSQSDSEKRATFFAKKLGSGAGSAGAGAGSGVAPMAVESDASGSPSRKRKREDDNLSEADLKMMKDFGLTTLEELRQQKSAMTQFGQFAGTAGAGSGAGAASGQAFDEDFDIEMQAARQLGWYR